MALASIITLVVNAFQAKLAETLANELLDFGNDTKETAQKTSEKVASELQFVLRRLERMFDDCVLDDEEKTVLLTILDDESSVPELRELARDQLTKQQIANHEAFMSKVYDDANPYDDQIGREGNLTVGYGRNVDPKTGLGITQQEAFFLLANDLERCKQEADDIFSDFSSIQPFRQMVILNMLFALGKPRFLGFKKMITAIKKEDWKEASKELLDSRFARRVKTRADQLAFTLQSNTIHV